MERILKYVGMINKAIAESKDLFDVLIALIKMIKEDYNNVREEIEKIKDRF